VRFKLVQGVQGVQKVRTVSGVYFLFQSVINLTANFIKVLSQEIISGVTQVDFGQ